MSNERSNLDHAPVGNTLRNAFQSLLGRHPSEHFPRASFRLLSIKICGVLTVFLVQIPLTRLLGAQDYGTYVYVLSWITIAGIVTNFGMDTAFVRYIATGVANQSWAQLKGILTFGLAAGAIISITIATAVYVFLAVDGRLGASLSLYFPGAAALLVALTIFGLVRSALRGLELVVLAEILDSIVRPMLLLVVFLFFFIPGSLQGGEAALWANALAVLLVLVVLSGYLWRHLPPPAKMARADFSRVSEWLSLALPMILMAGMNVLLSRTDIIMLGTMEGPAVAGVYAVGSRFAELATLGLAAVNIGLAPRIANMYHSGQRDGLQNLLTVAVWLGSAFTVFIAIFLALLGPNLLSLFGDEFPGGYQPMLVLLAGQTINALAGSVGYLMTMTGRQKQATTILFFVVSANIAGNLVLIPVFGMIGAAMSTALGIVVMNAILLHHVVTRIHLNPSIWPWLRSGR